MNIYFFFFMRLYSQSDTTVVPIVAVIFKEAAIIIATRGQKTLQWQLSKVILSGILSVILRK